MRDLTERANYRAPWSGEDQSLLEGMLAEGKTVAEIAREMERTQEGVRNRAWKSGLLSRRSVKQ